jgi:hypothetical protein
MIRQVMPTVIDLVTLSLTRPLRVQTAPAQDRSIVRCTTTSPRHYGQGQTAAVRGPDRNDEPPSISADVLQTVHPAS